MIKIEENYVVYHLHTELSLLDSTTNFKDYIHKAKELGQKAICFTEHGNTLNWIEKKMYCESTQYLLTVGKKQKYFDDKKKLDKYIVESNISEYNIRELPPIKYLHGAEVYLTETLSESIRDNYHTILIAKTFPEGFRELNALMDLSTREDHTYYKPRITFDEFLNISENVIKISACLASPLNQLPKRIDELRKENAELEAKEEKNPGDAVKIADNLVRIHRAQHYYEKIISAYDYYEIQPHVNSEEQKEYNRFLLELSSATGTPLIAGTDTHSLDFYKAECRQILQYAKYITFQNEDEFDLTFKSYGELVELFEIQNAIPREEFLLAINNTNVMADSVQSFVLDKSFKYPVLYENEEQVLLERIERMRLEKVARGEIEDIPEYQKRIDEEMQVFRQIGMIGFMLFMSELVCWCHDNGIPTGPCRGSVGGSMVAYITDIIDVDPIIWKTVFSRFANKDRKELGDIDLDFAPDDREKVFKHIIESFGSDYTAYILTTNTIQDKGTIDEIVRAFHVRYCKQNGLDPKKDKSKYSVQLADEIKDLYDINPEKAKEKYKDILYYMDGLKGVVISKGFHPAGIVVSPLSLPDNYGTFWTEGIRVMCINMEEIHEVSLLKYDILGLKNIGIIRDTYKLLNKPYPKAYEIDWNDKEVWEDMITSPVGIFQFEGDYAFDLLKRFKPKIITHMSIVNAALRPSGTSYRDRLIAGEINKNPSKQIDELLADNRGFLVFQEDSIKFLTDICGLSGSDADNIRRAIGRKQKDRLEAALPDILEGYCAKSDKPREVAEEEAKVFLQIIEDSSSYQFGYNHSTGYSMIGYMCAMLRYHYPKEFITAYLNNAANENDITSGTELAKQRGIQILPIQFRHSKYDYFPGEDNQVYKGLSSVKYMSEETADAIYNLKNKQYDSFVNLLYDIPKSVADARQKSILIKLDFFKEFGDINYLLKIYEIFDKFSGKKVLKKKELTEFGLSEEVARTFCDKETEKQFSEINNNKMVYHIIKKSKWEPITLRQRVDYQMEYLGYIDVVDKSYAGQVYVESVDTKYSPKLKVYAFANGKSLEVKIATKLFKKNPVEKGDVLIVEDQQRKCKCRKTESGEFENIPGEYVWWITKYRKVMSC